MTARTKASIGGTEYASCNPFRGGTFHFSLIVLIPGEPLSHNFVADDECNLAFDINTTRTGLINKEDAVGSLNLHSNVESNGARDKT